MNKNNVHENYPLTRELEDFQAGKIKFRTWRLDPKTRRRTMSYKGIAELRQEKAGALKAMRMKELKMSQTELARVIRVSPRTLQGWEIGRSMIPEPVLILVRLLRDLPNVRKKLAQA